VVTTDTESSARWRTLAILDTALQPIAEDDDLRDRAVGVWSVLVPAQQREQETIESQLVLWGRAGPDRRQHRAQSRIRSRLKPGRIPKSAFRRGGPTGGGPTV
jgi:hypothetical protein